jgi:hypothetical protein
MELGTDLSSDDRKVSSMTTQTHDPQASTRDAAETAFVPARVYLSADGRGILHVLPDGTTTARPVSFYRALLERTSRRESKAWSVLTTPAAKLAMTLIAWLVRLLLVAWLAFHPGTSLPPLESPAAVDSITE